MHVEPLRVELSRSQFIQKESGRVDSGCMARTQLLALCAGQSSLAVLSSPSFPETFTGSPASHRVFTISLLVLRGALPLTLRSLLSGRPLGEIIRLVREAPPWQRRERKHFRIIFLQQKGNFKKLIWVCFIFAILKFHVLEYSFNGNSIRFEYTGASILHLIAIS